MIAFSRTSEIKFFASADKMNKINYLVSLFSRNWLEISHLSFKWDLTFNTLSSLCSFAIFIILVL